MSAAILIFQICAVCGMLWGDVYLYLRCKNTWVV